MQIILRTIDSFQIKGRGHLYIMRNETPSYSFKINDIFYDLQHHRFRLIGIEMVRRLANSPHSSDTYGLLFENLDSFDILGTLLVKIELKFNWLYNNHPLYPQKIDPDYQSEYEFCKTLYECALFSYEDLEHGILSLYGSQIHGLTIYRGWMMKPELYTKFYYKLKEMNIILINSPEEYEHYHTLPLWYPEFSEFTAKSFWTHGSSICDVLPLFNNFSYGAIVKDFVKSRKHEWYHACFIPNVKDTKNALQIINNFIHHQGDSLVGGVVLREFIELNNIGYHEKSGMPISEEYRVFILCGKVFIFDTYWNSPQNFKLNNDDLKFIQALIPKIHSNFVTADFARRKDGSLMLMEFGDGQVSGLQQIPVKDFYSSLDTY